MKRLKLDRAVVARIFGGLGNQMFQYACGRALALRHGVPLMLDLGWFDDPGESTPRRYGLDVFSIEAETAGREETAVLTREGMGPAGKLFYAVLHGPREKRYFRERTAGIYDGSLESAAPPVYITGYWQSERYFRDAEKVIREDFTFRLTPPDGNRDIIEEITGTESVGVHVRRGDYVEKPGAARMHGGVCGEDYYRRAISLVAGKVKRPFFFFFSDDIEWVENNLRVRDPSRYIGGNAGDRDWEDMRLMSLCKNNIVANSSFSWWAAWLNVNPGKIVIAPSRWFSDEGRADRDIVPSGWVRV